jgi:hypothetical protein
MDEKQAHAELLAASLPTAAPAGNMSNHPRLMGMSSVNGTDFMVTYNTVRFAANASIQFGLMEATVPMIESPCTMQPRNGNLDPELFPPTYDCRARGLERGSTYAYRVGSAADGWSADQLFNAADVAEAVASVTSEAGMVNKLGDVRCNKLVYSVHNITAACRHGTIMSRCHKSCRVHALHVQAVANPGALQAMGNESDWHLHDMLVEKVLENIHLGAKIGGGGAADGTGSVARGQSMNTKFMELHQLQVQSSSSSSSPSTGGSVKQRRARVGQGRVPPRTHASLAHRHVT